MTGAKGDHASRQRAAARAGQAVLRTVRERLGIGGGFEDFLGDLAGDLVLAVAVGDAADKGGDDDLRALAADGEHGVVEHAVVAPSREGFFLSFGEAEVDFSAPELFCAVKLVGFEEFIGADEAQRVVAVGGHERSGRLRRG